MDLRTLKLQLIQRILQTDDAQLLQTAAQLLEMDRVRDRIEHLLEKVQADHKIYRVSAGNVEEVKAKFNGN